MQILFLCNTYYQFIVASQLKLTQFKEDDVYLILSDHSKNAKNIIQKANRINFFKKIFFIETLEDDKKSLRKNMLPFVITPKITKNQEKFKELYDLKIDRFIYYNFLPSSLYIFSILYENNPIIKCSRMEEGILSYQMHFNDDKFYLGKKESLLVFTARKLLGKKNLYECVNDFYCFQPNFYKGILNPVKIEPVSSNGQLKDFLVKVFGIDLREDDYKEKYIFFTSAFDFDGGKPIGEYDLVCTVADLVGKENLLVKTHPRDTRTIYEDNGFIVDKNSSIPWEAIQFSRDFSDKVFLTMISGSVLAGSFMSKNPPKTFFIYKCCNVEGNTLAQTSADTIEKLLSEETLKTALKTVTIANDIKDILT